jgi:hypothetical protein
MRIFMRVITWALGLAFIASPLVVVVLGVERTAMVTENPESSFNDFSGAYNFFTRFDPRQMKPDEVTTITNSAGELNGALTAALSGRQRVHARVDVASDDVTLGATYELPWPEKPLGHFVNLKISLAGSDTGLKISRFSVGALAIPPAIITPVLRLGFNVFAGSGKAEAILASVLSVKLAGDQVTVVYQPSADLGGTLKVADLYRVRVYYERLHELVLRDGTARQSLAPYVSEVFQMAVRRSVGSDPVEENKAAIIALAMYFGDPRFERFVGEVRIGPLKSVVPRVDHVQLQGRRDWVQHFVVSAGLVVASNVGIANFIGEGKEARDAEGSSGFSFTDIGADRTGVRFAEKAIGSMETAQDVQRALSRPITENDFFPMVMDLPEGLSEAEFRRRYTDINSPEYTQMIAAIDQRIGAIPLYP